MSERKGEAAAARSSGGQSFVAKTEGPRKPRAKRGGFWSTVG